MHVIDKWDDAVKRYAKNEAIIWAESINETRYSNKLTYEEIDKKSNKLANYIIKLISEHHILGGKDFNEIPIVTLFCERDNPNWIISLFAAWKSRAAVLIIDTSFSIEIALNRIANCGSRLLIVDNERFKGYLKFAKMVDELLVIELSKENIGELSSPHIENMSDQMIKDIKRDVKDLAYIAYTSGSTGAPKAVAINHQRLVAVADSHQEYFELKQEDRVLQNSNLAFDACYVELMMIFYGVSIILPARTEHLLIKLHEIIQQNCITTIILVPSVLKSLEPNMFPTLKNLISTGEYAHPELYQHWYRDGMLKILIGYGPTEVCIGSSLLLYQGEERISLGEEMKQCEMRLMNTKEFTIIEKVGESGEIVIAGDGIAIGYLKDGAIWDEKTHESFIHINDKRYYRTGDIAQYNETMKLVFKGRQDRQYKISGVRIEALAIEANLRELLQPIKFSEVYVLPNGVFKNSVAYFNAFLISKNLDETKKSIKDTEINLLSVFDKNKLKQLIPLVAMPRKYFLMDEQILIDNNVIKCDDNKKETPKIIAFLQSQGLEQSSELLFVDDHVQQSRGNSLEREIINIYNNIFLENMPITTNHLDCLLKDIGVNSLGEVRLIAKLEDKFEVSLTNYPNLPKELTLSILAREIARRVAFDKSIKKINVESKKILITLPPISGSSTEFRKLNDKFQAEQTFLSICLVESPYFYNLLDEKPYDFDYNDYACQTLDEMVDYTIYALREILVFAKKLGISGYSYGGIYAMLLAFRLQSLRKEIAWLGLFDPSLPKAFALSIENSNQGLKDVLNIVITISKKIFNDEINLDDLKQCLFNMADAEILMNVNKSKLNKLNIFFDNIFKIFDEKNDIVTHEKKIKLTTILQIIKGHLLTLCDMDVRNFNFKVDNFNNNTFLYQALDSGYFSNNDNEKTESWNNYFTTPIYVKSYGCKHLALLEDKQFQEDVNLHVRQYISNQPTDIYHDVSILPENHIERSGLLNVIKEQFEKTAYLGLIGEGGIGKTQLAKDFMINYEKNFEITYFILAETFESIVEGYESLAQILRTRFPYQELIANSNRLIKENKIKANIDVKEIQRDIFLSCANNVHQALVARSYLLIFDNIEDELLLNMLLNNLNDCASKAEEKKVNQVLYTKRISNLRTDDVNLGSVEMMIKGYEEQESINYILKSLPHFDKDILSELVNISQGNPLALRHLVDYTKIKEIQTINEIQQLNISNIFDVNYQYLKEAGDKIDHKNSTASPIDLLHYLAYISPDNISQFLIDILLPNSSWKQRKYLLDSLFHTSFLNYGISGFTIHRKNQEFLLSKIKSEKLPVKDELLKIYHNTFIYDRDDSQAIKRCEQLLPHVLYLLEHFQLEFQAAFYLKLQLASMELGQRMNFLGVRQYLSEFIDKPERLLAKVSEALFVKTCIIIGTYYFCMEHFAEAINKFKCALNLSSNKEIKNNVDIQYCKLLTAKALIRLTKKDKRRAINLLHSLISDECTKISIIAESYHSMAITYCMLQEYDKARQNIKIAKSLNEKISPLKLTVRKAVSIHVHGWIERADLKDNKANKLFKQSYKMKKQIYKNTVHDNMAGSLCCLGYIAFKTLNFGLAEKYFRKAIKIRMQFGDGNNLKDNILKYNLSCVKQTKFFLKQKRVKSPEELTITPDEQTSFSVQCDYPIVEKLN